MEGSTVAGNTAPGGGGISAADYSGIGLSVIVRNSTIADNLSTGGGGGMAVSGGSVLDLLIQIFTITANTAGSSYGGGVFLGLYNLSVFAIQSSIVAGNSQVFAGVGSG